MKVIWTRLKGRLRRLALRMGWLEPRVKYPFNEVMQRYPSDRANYRWGILSAAFVAKQLGYPRISVIEFGVASGNGLVRMEKIAQYAQELTGVGIDVYGFDTGQGLPKPQDYRDLPQLWAEGDFSMDVPALEARLQGAKLRLGLVADTVAGFLEEKPAPIGFISFDLDLYSSTCDAFKILAGGADTRLPRVHCYFDDIIGYSHSEFTGERLAISEFNQSQPMQKISPIFGLRPVLGLPAAWLEMMYLHHDFEHPRYNDFDGQNTITDIPMD